MSSPEFISPITNQPASPSPDFRFNSVEQVREASGLIWAATTSLLLSNDLSELAVGIKSTCYERIRHFNSLHLTPVLVEADEDSQKEPPFPDVVFLTLTEIERIHKQTTLQQKVDGLLRNLIELATEVGAVVADPRFTPTRSRNGFTSIGPSPLAQAFPGYRSTYGELCLALDWLEQQGLIKVDKGIRITLQGYQYAETHSQTLQHSKHVFLVCAFKSVTDDVFNARFAPTYAESGYPISRIKDHDFNGKVDDEILLKSSQKGVSSNF